MGQVTVQKIDRSRTDLMVATSALLLLVAYSPSLLAGFWSPRAAVALVLAAVGLPRLVTLYRSPLRRAALGATAFLAVATLSTLASNDRRASLLGIFNWGTGLLFVAVLIGAWAAGASTSTRGRILLEQAVVGGVLVNVVVAVAEVVVDLSRFALRLQGGRASGLLGNPVHLGAVAAAGTALFASRVTSGRWRWLVAVLASAAAVQVSGSRTALGVLAAVVVWGALRSPRKVSALVVAAAVVLGLGAGSLATRVGGGALESSSSGRLLVVESGGLGARLGVWEAAAKAIAHRPLLGAGPGRFRAATLARRSRAAAQAEGPDRAFVDGHNLLVEYATTTGLAGAACLLMWLITAVRRGSGPLLAVALALLAAHLLEPQSVSSTPIAFLLLGASSSVVGPPARARLRVQAATAVLVALAVFGSAHLLIGDWWLYQTHLDLRVSQGRHAVSILPPWPTSAVQLSLSYVFTGQDRHDPVQFVAARHWLGVAVQRDRSDPMLWDALADEELSDGLSSAAATHYLQALRLDPWSVRTRNGMGHVEESLGHAAGARQWFEASLALEPRQPAVIKELARLKG